MTALVLLLATPRGGRGVVRIPSSGEIDQILTLAQLCCRILTLPHCTVLYDSNFAPLCCQILTSATVMSDSNLPDELILTLWVEWICNWPEWRYAAAATGRGLIAKVPLAVSPRIISFPITSIAKYQVVTSLTKLGSEQHLPCPYSLKGGASSSQSFSQLLNILRLCCWNNELSFQVRLRLSELWNCLKLHK